MKNIILLFALTIMLNTAFAQVSINEDNSTPDVSAMLDIKSSDKGILVPRMSSAQRNLISNPAVGLLVYDLTTASFWFYNGNVWNNLSAISNNRIADADNDTKIQVEESADEDIIRFDMAGTEFFRMDSGRLEIFNTGRSVFIGEKAGVSDDLTNNANVFVGYQTGQVNTSGENNSALGANAFDANTTGSNNSALGFEALSQNIDGDDNIAIGKGNLRANTSGNSNVSLGANAGATSIGDRNVFLGFNAGFKEKGSHKLYIDNTIFSTPLIYGDFANDSLKIYGTLGIKDNYTFPNTDGAANELLQTDGNGNASWQAIKAGAILGPNYISEPDSPYTKILTFGSISGVIMKTPMLTEDAQTLTYSGTTLSITGGNSVNIASVQDNLGDHIADTVIQLNGNYVSNDGGNEGIAINDIGHVGIGTTSPTNILHIAQAGGIQLTNSEIGNVNENPGTILYDANYYAAGEAGDGHFNGNGGGLAIYDGTDGWGAIVSTATMQYLELDLSSLHIGGTSDPGDGNLIVDGVLKIASGNPGNGKILTSNADGDATWEDDQAPDILFANTTATQSFSNSDVWRAVTPWSSLISNNNSEALFKLEAAVTSRLTSGGGNDDFEFRVEMDFGGVTFYSDVHSYRPDEMGGEHDNFKTVPYLFFLNPPVVGGNVKFRLNVRNTGDNAWEVQDCVLFVTKY